MLKRKTLCDNFVAERFLDGLRRNGLVLDAVVLLRAFGVVEMFQRADQIAGDAADALHRLLGGFMAVATGTLVPDDAGVAADRVAVDRVVDGAVADACLFHTANQLHEGFGVLAGVAVQLDIGDVPAVGQRVVGSFQANLLEGVDVVVDRNGEGVGVVVAVCLLYTSRCV